MNPSDHLEAICLATITEYRMLQRGDHIAVGLSGGADSVALLHFLREIAGEWGLRLTAAHLNHNLRGEESHRDEAFVRGLCEAWDIPLAVESLAVGELAAQEGRSVEECARNRRYDLFRRVAGNGKAATAHSLDDSAETVLLNLARGTGLRGLCGIPPVREGVVRPLIRCSREQVEDYCRRWKLAFVTDSTNLTDAYTRNRLRHRVLPELRELNPALLRGIAGMTDALRADADYLDALAAEALARARLERDCYSAPGLSATAEPLRRRVLSLLLQNREIPVDRQRILQVERLLLEGGKAQLSGQWYCARDKGALVFLPAAARPSAPASPPPLPLPLRDGAVCSFNGRALQIRIVDGAKYKKNINNTENQFKNALDCDKIGKIAELRHRLPGDRICLAGRGCTKTLRKLFNEEGYPPRMREQALVVSGENGLLWVEGFGVAEQVSVGPETRRVLQIVLAD